MCCPKNNKNSTLFLINDGLLNLKSTLTFRYNFKKCLHNCQYHQVCNLTSQIMKENLITLKKVADNEIYR